MNAVSVPFLAMSYAAELGISDTVLATLLHPAVPFREQLTQDTASIASFPTLVDADMRADTAELLAVTLQVRPARSPIPPSERS